MVTLEFDIFIAAAPDKVWENLWRESSYKAWTSVFSQGSYYKTDAFKAGNRIHFLTPSGEGMYSTIETVEPPRLMVFRHLGEIKDFEEQAPADGFWNSEESYHLEPDKNGTSLKVKVETLEEYVDPMKKMFPEALEELKKITEA